jgi:CubicO group peptidase (beta-lactamase class C family)
MNKIYSACMVVLLSISCFKGGIPLAAEPKGQQPIPNARFDKVKEMILKEIEEGTIPSASVAVAQGGEIIWLESFGWADIEERIAATPRTPYPIASITKTMTATGIMLLAERGDIDIKQSVNRYVAPLELTAYHGSAGDVTVRHLLNHTAGIAMHFNYFYEDEDRVPPGVEEAIERYGFLTHAPGEVFQYANLGYALLGHTISKVTGRPFERFLGEEVFEPLGMHHTWVGGRTGGPLPAATKYDTDLRPIPQALPYATPAGAGFSSAYDLIRFGMFHLGDRLKGQKRILNDSSIEAMQSTRDETATYLADTYYGFGWFFKESEGGYKVCWHEGGMGGARTILKLVPSEDIAVVVLLNGWNDPLPGLLAKEILTLLLPGYISNLEREKRIQSPPFDRYIASPDFTGTWRGSIKTPEGDVPVYMIFQEDGDIHFLKQLDINRRWVLQNQGLFDRVLNNVGIKGNRIYGWVDARLPTADTARLPHILVVDIVRNGKKIEGSVAAISADDRMYFGLSHYIRLEKTQ